MYPVHARCPDGVVRVFDGPGLLRRPNLGEVLVSRRTDRRLIVDRFDSIHESIVHYRDEQTGAQGMAIWRFGDGELNRLLRHEDTP